MTKKEFLDGCISHKEWLEVHEEYINKEVYTMSNVFNVNGFIQHFSNKAEKDVLESILAWAFSNENYEPFERDDYLARMLVVDPKEILQFELLDEIGGIE